jgi:tRNA modification GTPase
VSYDLHDTIAAIASAPGGAARGSVRISGPDVLEKLSACFRPDDPSLQLSGVGAPRRISGVFYLRDNGRDGDLELPGHLLLWPSARSYTRQPAAEFHTTGSPPLLAAVIDELARLGIRAAEPGEFTMRAFLAGRIDLTQAEAVLGVIDARERDELDAALDQLAGGLSRPLHRIRQDLLAVLAELEAGLDFVEEDIEFVTRRALCERLLEAQAVVAEALKQISGRDVWQELPRVVIVGPPNAGKSSLFNALVRRFGSEASPGSIVSPEPGATRDYVSERIVIDRVECLLVDTAGIDPRTAGRLHGDSQQMSESQRRRAEVRLFCRECTQPPDCEDDDPDSEDILVVTKCDLDGGEPQAFGCSGNAVCCSSVTGAGLDELALLIRERIAGNDRGPAAFAAATSARCLGSLREADRAIAAALDLTENAGEELIAAELRAALAVLGDVVGATTADDVLDRIFSQFCIGK